MMVIVDNQAVVSSREFAHDFGFQHRHVLARIRAILTKEQSLNKYFIKSSYNCRGRIYPEYLITRDGFTLLVPRKKLWIEMKYIESYKRAEKPAMTMPELVAFSALRVIEHEQIIKNLKDCYVSVLREIVKIA